MQPPSSDTPLIGTYFSCIMLMVACSVVCTVLILNYDKRTGETHVMPWWIETIFLQWLPWMLLMERPGVKFEYSTILMDAKMRKLEREDKMPRKLVPDLLNTTEDFLAGNLANANFPLFAHHEAACTSKSLETISPSESSLSLPKMVPIKKRPGSNILSQSVKLEPKKQAVSPIEKDLQVIKSKR